MPTTKMTPNDGLVGVIVCSMSQQACYDKIYLACAALVLVIFIC